MIKCEVIEQFSLGAFDKLNNLKRANTMKNEEHKLYVGDVFECDEELAKYLIKNDITDTQVIKVIEIKPEKRCKNGYNKKEMGKSR